VYVDALVKLLKCPKTIVDLGCGDFAVGRELLQRFPTAHYIGCDIVPELIRHHQRIYASDRASFRLIDIVTEPIPRGDVCLIRQVFQHLSNDDIMRVLKKLEDCPRLIVTEGQPLELSGPKNRDKIAGGNTRFDTATGIGSGVYLDAPPFNKNLEELCRVEMPGNEQIITWRVW
jgi:SAM-dependent methyltransferase